MSSKCIPEDKYITYAIGNWHTHPSHNIVLYGGVYFCVKCGSAALNKIQNLKYACEGIEPDKRKIKPHQSHGEANIKRYNKGRSPLGFLDWPYNKFEISHDTVMNNIQGQLRGISTECPAPPTPEPDDEALLASDNSSDELSSDGDSGSGGSE